MILAEVYVPALNQKYDFKLDENAYVAEVIDELGDALVPPAGNFDECTEELLLCSYETDRIFRLDRTLKQEGIGNGCRLVLI